MLQLHLSVPLSFYLNVTLDGIVYLYSKIIFFQSKVKYFILGQIGQNYNVKLRY